MTVIADERAPRGHLLIDTDGDEVAVPMPDALVVACHPDDVQRVRDALAVAQEWLA